MWDSFVLSGEYVTRSMMGFLFGHNSPTLELSEFDVLVSVSVHHGDELISENVGDLIG